MLFWTLNALCNAHFDSELRELIVVARCEEFPSIREVWEQLGISVPFSVVEGGATRQDSVEQGVRAARGDYVLVHDAARPCISSEIVARTVVAAHETGAAIAALPVSDTVKQADAAGNVAQTLDRKLIWLAQTPQVFRRDWFLAALEQARAAGFAGTDCASILEHAGHDVALVEGEVNNLKITFAADLERAAAILAARSARE